jgi:hypothetical protein
MSPLFLFTLLVLAIGIYVAYMWISDIFPVSAINHTTTMFFSSGQTYFTVLFGVCLILFLDGIIISVDYDNLGTIKKLRDILHEEKEYQESEYEKQSIKFTVGTEVQRQP